MDPETGRFVYPTVTPHQHESKPFEGQLDYWDTNEYAKAMTVEAYYPITVEPFHTWQNIVDFDGRRYMYQYVRRASKSTTSPIRRTCRSSTKRAVRGPETDRAKR